MAQTDILTDEAINRVLEPFDQMELQFQRRAIAEIVGRLAKAEEELLGQIRLKGFARIVQQYLDARKRMGQSKSTADLHEVKRLEVHIQADCEEILEERKTLFNQG